MRVSFYSAGLFRGGFCLKVTQILLTYYFFRVVQSHKAQIFPKRFASSLKIHFVTHVQSSFCEVSLHLFTETIE